MQNYGLQPGDIISICSHNQFDCGATFLAATFLGVINANLDPSLPEDSLKYLLQIIKPKLLFASKECENLTKSIIQDLQLATKIVVYGDEFSKFIQRNVEQFTPYICRDLNETIIVKFSSGTTNLPKAMCLSHNFFLYETRRQAPPVFFNTSTFYWFSGSISLISGIRSGSTRAHCKNVSDKFLWDSIEKYKIDFVLMPTYHVIKFVASKPPEHTTTLKLLILGGSGTSKENVLKIKQKIPNTQVVIPYAITEIGSISYPYNEISYNKHISAGLIIENVACKIVDPETEESLGLNQKGEIRIKTKYHLTGYYGDSSKHLFDADGFYKTGDIGYLDEDLCLFIVDRIKLMFKYRGCQIVPVQLEEVLMKHPDVQNAAIVPVPHPEDDSHILAVVELKRNSNATEATIEKYYNDQLDENHKIRAGVKIVHVIPLTPSGKIARNILKNTILKEL